MTDFFREALLPINLLFYFFAYALAATPTSYLVARRMHGLDIKKNQQSLHSSLYIWRNISKKSGLLVFVLDSLKGIIPCAIAYSLMTPPAIIAIIDILRLLVTVIRLGYILAADAVPLLQLALCYLFTGRQVSLVIYFFFCC